MEIKLPNSLNELTLGQYLQFSTIAGEIKDDGSIENTLRTYKLIEVLANATEEQIDELSLAQVAELTTGTKELIDAFVGFESKMEPFEIDGVWYASKSMDELDNGEYISLNILKEQYGNDTFALFPKLLAVLIRPATKKYDEEKKEDYWELEKFNRRDMLNLEYRADLFYRKAKAQDVIPIINFFLTMKETSA